MNWIWIICPTESDYAFNARGGNQTRNRYSRLHQPDQWKKLNVLHRHQSGWRSEVAHAVPMGLSHPVPHRCALSIAVHPRRATQRRLLWLQNLPRTSKTMHQLHHPTHHFPRKHLATAVVAADCLNSQQRALLSCGCCSCALEAQQQRHLLDSRESTVNTRDLN